jgi:hypothetical protein
MAMNTAIMTSGVGRDFSGSIVKFAARFCFAVLVAGQLVFGFSIAAFYGLASWRGHWESWNHTMKHGYIPGASMGNAVVAAHVLTATIVVLTGTMQLIPAIRQRLPALHRWTGRVYLLSAAVLGNAGVIILLTRSTGGDLSLRIGTTIDALLILVFAALTLRTALAREFVAHREWALRLFVVVSAAWFFRVVVTLVFAVNGGPFGFDPRTTTGPFITFMTFAQYLGPLAVLELYLEAGPKASARRRTATGVGLIVLTLAMAAGIALLAAGSSVPNIKLAFDSRIPISEPLTATLESAGIEQAVKQYHALKQQAPQTYNFDETELNSLGYRLISEKRLDDAVRVFQLNVEAYPNSSNTYDSLGESYMDEHRNDLAIANYMKALEVDPKNKNSAMMLRQLRGS